MEHETWLPVVGFEGFYEVSDLGRVRSVPHSTARGWRGGRIRKPQGTGPQRAYLAVTLSREGMIAQRKVHHLVLEAFVGPRPADMEGLHENDNPGDNRLTNLRWGTHEENQDDMSRRGRAASGERNGNARLTNVQVDEIRSALTAGVSGNALARYHGISKAQVSRIRNGHNR